MPGASGRAHVRGRVGLRSGMLESRRRMRGPAPASIGCGPAPPLRSTSHCRPPPAVGRGRPGDAVGSSAAVRPGCSSLAAVTPSGVRARRLGALLAGRCIARGADRRAVGDGAGSMGACAPLAGRSGGRGRGGGGGGRAGWGTIGRGVPERHVDRAGDARRTCADRDRGGNRGCLQRRRGANRRGGHAQAGPRRAPTRSEGAGGARPRRLYPCLADLACNSGEQPRGDPHRQRRTQGLQVGAAARDAGAKVPAGLAGVQVCAHPACPAGCAHRAPKALGGPRRTPSRAPEPPRAAPGAPRTRPGVPRPRMRRAPARSRVAQATQLAHDQGDTLAVPATSRGRRRAGAGARAVRPASPPPAPAAPAAPDRRPRAGGAGSRSTRCGQRGKATAAARFAAHRRAAPSGRPPSCSGARPAPREDPPGLRGRSDRAPGDSAERWSRTRAGRPAVRGRPGARRRAASAEPAEIGAGRVPPPRQWPSP